MVEWLRSIGCQKYDSVFESGFFSSSHPEEWGRGGGEKLLTKCPGNNITGETLLECDHSALKELGITKVGDRVRIFVAIKALRTKAFGNNGKKRNRVLHKSSPPFGNVI